MRAVTITPDIAARQRRAADPDISAWVSANAGSGKTHVLTQRVLRLLLTGVAPEQILCLTYTKAAAAEMRKRVSAQLGQWAVAEEAALRASLADLEGRAPDAARLNRARTLFAHALETPGGLKIQTIHAFCESVLHRFPKEAGVPFDFSVVEDVERERMVLAARERVIAAGLRGEGAAGAVATLFDLMSDSQIGDAIATALAEQRTLRHVIADVRAAKANLRALVKVQLGRDDVLTTMAEGYGLTVADHAAIFADAGGAFVGRLREIDPQRPDPQRLRAAFLTKDGTMRKTLLKKVDAAALSAIADKVLAEGARLEQLNQELLAAELVERSDAVLEVLAAIVARYETQKRALSLLDFDDLIEALRRLLANPALGAWVRYKLDAGITHILVDESQDTNAEQWDVVAALTGDFFDGEGAAERPRTIFAVGDEKQSIYSFQGADPQLFLEAGNRYAMLSQTARLSFASVRLKTSFRALPNILGAVDLTFIGDVQRTGLLSEMEPVAHDSARADKGGVVTLWPPEREADIEADPHQWATEPSSRDARGAARRIAERIAREIKHWIESKRPLGRRGRAVNANDVLILVQTRGELFREVIRALVRADIPTPGVDRVEVTRHVAVLDLMALGDVLGNPADDLQLAALLRSPLFDIDEDDLFAIAQPRPEKNTLWAALAASGLPAAKVAYERLHAWRARLDFERPFDFYSGVLYAEGGLKRFHARLGAEVDDVLAEFLELALDHERAPQPSLLGFLKALREAEIAIKRELGGSSGGVRTMTVHGAKGLEAPIVIIADAVSTDAGKTGKPVYLRGGSTPLLIHAGGLKAHIPQTLAIRELDEAAALDEYWRRLYVAMTRAEDELYVTGALSKAGKLEGSWYEAIDVALRPEAEVLIQGEVETALIYPRARPVPAPGAPTPAPSGTPPDSVLAPLPPYHLRRIVRPSLALSRVAPETALDSTLERLADPRDPEPARLEGLALHALLQHLSRLDPALWPAIAGKAMPMLLPDAPADWDRVAAKAQAILTRPELAQLFGPNSRAEVPILAQGSRNDLPVTIAGRIDRLVVEPGRVLVVDYKSDANPPAHAAKIAPAYVLQLGLYARIAGLLFPGHAVEAAILWTALESLMILPARELSAAVADFTIG